MKTLFKTTVLNTTITTGLSVGVASAIALVAPAAIAQSYSIPISNGSFAVTNTGSGNQFTTPTITFLSPAGTLTGLTASPQVHFQPGVTLTDQPTAIGVYLEQVQGAVNLNDGRSGTFVGGVAGLETEATISGATANWQPVANGYFQNATVPLNSTVNFNIRNGYLTFPTTNLSAFPATNINIPITGGTFTLNAPAGAAPETLTLTGLVTPLGTANLTIANPIVVNPRNFYPLTLVAAEDNILLGGVANGTAALGNGETAYLNNATFLFNGTAQVTTGGTYTLPRVFTDAKVVTGQLGQGVISVPVTALQAPIPTPPVGRPEPVPPTGSEAGGSGIPGTGTTPTAPAIAGTTLPTRTEVLERSAPETTDPLSTRPTTTITESAIATDFSLAQNVSLKTEPTSFLPPRPTPLAIEEEDSSPLSQSRIHPALRN